MGILLFAMIAGLQAQGGACPAKQVPAVVTVEVREKSVLEPVRGLTVSDLVLRGKGVEGSPTGLAVALPADIVVLIEDRGRGGLLAGAADLLVKSLLPGDRVAVMTYGVSTKKQLEWSKDPEAIRLAVEKGADGMHLQVARPLYGVVDALKLFEKAEPGRQRAIFMLGDNIDSGSQIRVEQLAASLIEDRVVLDLAVDPAPNRFIPRVNVPPPTVGNSSPAMRAPLVGQQSVERLAEASGGTADKYVRAEFFSAMRERLKGRVTVMYCVEKKHVEKAPTVELSEAGKKRFSNAEVLGPGTRGARE
jgi:hypothetical protein